ncbi:hypothetical protein MWU52_10075 [Jannaschia sp. S6380]|uniref:DUF6732 family protein n=1 Tax=Jannaschia sp. S6380 TaxID=2926408 RepID=UPI001FF6F02A|nr:DUF6732 family protein [Jannaschia sp. S6380]MCK0167895.1 hypothetical protein [Jannaschia sp. S6380]
MRFPILLTPAILAAGPAAAHTGHIGELAGHDHWVLGVGLGVIAGAAVIGWLKGDKESPEPEAEPEEEAEQPA